MLPLVGAGISLFGAVLFYTHGAIKCATILLDVPIIRAQLERLLFPMASDDAIKVCAPYSRPSGENASISQKLDP